MTIKKKIFYLRIALGLQGIPVKDEMCDRIITTYETILEKKGSFAIDDALKLELDLDRKYAKAKIEIRAEEAKDAD